MVLLALALLLVSPTAAAFRSTQQDLSISFDASGTPTMVSAGALFLDGVVSEGVVIAGASGTIFERVPELGILDRNALLTGNVTHRGATLELVAGAMLWKFPDGSVAEVATSERYAIALALPEAPIPRAAGAAPAGFVLTSEEITGTLGWTGGESMLIPLDAVVTVRDAAGQPLPDWNARRVNAGASASDDPDSLRVLFYASGAFTTRLSASILGGATAADAAPGASPLRLVVGAAEEDRYTQTAQRFAEASTNLFPEGAEQDPLAIFAPVSGLLNGAILMVPGAGGGAVPSTVLLESTFGGEEFPLGPLTLLRGSDLELAWTQGQMTVSGSPNVALGRDGFGIEEPVRVGIFPVVSLLLWAAAIGAVVYYFVRKPEPAKVDVKLRLASIAAYVVVLLVVLVLWDRSFHQTFGTSAGSVLRENGFASETLPTLGMLASLELVPWGLAALLFALPVRIAAGVGLRYLGKGKSFKGVATATGLVSLAIFGPIYALWCFNIVWARMSAALPAFGG